MDLKFYNIFQPCSVQGLFNEEKTAITSLSSYGNLIFVGTTDGKLVQCVFEEMEDDSTCYSFTIIFSRKISKFQIECVRASHYADMVATLSNSRLEFFDAEKLECSNLIHFIDNVSAFSLFNGSSLTSHHAILAVANFNGTLQLYRGTKSRFDLSTILTLPAPALDVCCIDEFTVVATATNYLSVDLTMKRSSEIFTRTDQKVQPLIEPVSETEFLLSGPGSLGIFVNVNGASERPPIALSPNLSSVFCRKSLIFAVDDEFISIHSVASQQQLQTLVLPDISAACMSLNRDLMFLVFGGDRICTLGPETWDQEARRLVLAGCTQDACQLITEQFAKLTDLCAERPATSSGAKSVFITRSKRVYTLMGFYFFELGQFTTSREFFEKSSLDIRELLYRYVDLLPRAYTFTPNPDFNVTYVSKANLGGYNETDLIPSPSTIFDLADSLHLDIREFRVFLFNFLQENRHSRIFKKHSQFVETALVKLCIFLSGESSDFKLPSEVIEDDDCQKVSWEHLIASLSNVDVDDLITFLTENAAHHTKSLLLRWNGDLVQGLDIWKKLAFSEIKDPAFPGHDFYIDALFSALVQPLAFRGRCGLSPDAVVHERADQLTCGNTLLAEQVWQHLNDMLEGSKQLQLAERFLIRLAFITSWTDDINSTGLSHALLASPSATTFPLAPGSLLKQLLPQFPQLAEKYLFVRVFQAQDSNSERHVQLAELQLTLMLKMDEEKSDLLIKQRSRFRKTIMCLKDCQTDTLLQKIKSSPSFSTFFNEYIILLGKLGKYTEALELLVNDRHNLRAALHFCDWCTKLQFEQRFAVEQLIWTSEKGSLGNKGSCSPNEQITSDLYTILFKMLLSSDDSGLNKSAMKLINLEIPTLDFVEILKSLSDDLAVEKVTNLIFHALRANLTRVAASELELGLTSRLCVVSGVERKSGVRTCCLQVNESSVCVHCNIALDAYGPKKAFAWLPGESDGMRVAHLHCLPGDSSF